MLGHVTAGALAIACVAVVIPIWGARRTTFLLFILCVTVGPKAITASFPIRYVGIAPPIPTYYTFTLVGALLLALLVVTNGFLVLRSVVVWSPFVVAALVAAHSAWPSDDLARAGELQLGSGVACWVIGAAAARAGWLRPSDLPRALYAVLGVESLAVLLDVTGHPIFVAHGPQSADLAGRVIGTAGHPDQLAKLMLLLIAGILSYRPSSVAETRVQRAALVAATAIIALTLSRAAFVGAVLGIFLNIVLEPDREIRRRQFWVAVGIAVAASASATAFIARFQHDASPGVRAELNAIALRATHLHLWYGVGPNHYVESVGRWSPLTASGVPVHDMFLLSLVELGLVAAVFLWLPLVTALARAVWIARDPALPGVAARALLSVAPGLLITGVTGWGLLQEPTLEFFGVMLGILTARMAVTHHREAAAVDRLRPALL